MSDLPLAVELVANVIREFERYGMRIDVYDPWVTAQSARHEYAANLVEKPRYGTYEAIVVAVPQRIFRDLGLRRIRRFAKPKHVVYDVKYLFKRNATDGRL